MMKTIRNSIIFLFSLAFLLSACGKDESYVGGGAFGEEMTIVASTEGASTRTALQKDGDYNVVWSQNDKILIGGNEFTLVSGEGTSEGEFVGSRLEDGIYTAYYGNPSGAMSLVGTQTITPGKISNVPMKAEVKVSDGEADPVCFEHLGGLLRIDALSEQGATVKSINITGYVLSSTSEPTLSIEVVCGGNGVPLSSQNGILYVSIPEGEYRDVRIEMNDTDGRRCTESMSDSKTLTIGRSMVTKFDFITRFQDLHNGHAYEDLGLPSKTRWATCNIGATLPKEIGDYLAWGETEAKAGNEYDWSHYKWCGGMESAINKYTYPARSKGDWKKEIDPDDDIASTSWGGEWRMPTKRELQELKEFCYWVWTGSYNDSGIQGYIVYRAKDELDKGVLVGKGGMASLRYALSDSHIFLPAGGRYDSSELQDEGSRGEYWSASVNRGVSAQAGNMSFDSGSVEMGDRTRPQGLTVRAVFQEPNTDPVPEFIDLGLRVKWATKNIGANVPEDYGLYFAWAETYDKQDYQWTTYKYRNKAGEMTKYGFDEILELEDDAAHRYVRGYDGRMPTHVEMRDLIDNCDFEWENNYNGVKGYSVFSNIKGYRHLSIFLPAAGFYSTTKNAEAGVTCNYWTSKKPYYVMGAYCFSSGPDAVSTDLSTFDRCLGLPVRAVCSK